MNAIVRRLLTAASLVGLIAPATVFATNGMYLIGFGAKSRAMGGAAIAMAEDSMIAAVNPAGVLYTGMRADVGAMLFIPRRRAACCLAPNGEVSGANLFLIPNMGMGMKFNRKMSMGFAFVGAGGGSTRYSSNLFDPVDDGSLGVNLMQGIMSPSVAYRITKNQSVGASLLIGIQTFRAYGLGPFKRFSAYPDKVTNNGNDWSYGAGVRFGWQGHFFRDRINVGAVYSSQIYMTKFDKYKGLFANEGEFNAPENWGIGLALKPTDKLTFAVDVTQTFYSDLKAVGNRALPISVALNSPANMGRSSGPGFGWKDQTVYKFGIQYEWNPKWTLRAGFNYGRSPIRDGNGAAELEFNLLATATTEKHYTAGVTYTLNRQMELSFAGMFAPKNTQSGYIPSGTGLPFEDQSVTIGMKQTAFEVSFAYNFM